MNSQPKFSRFEAYVFLKGGFQMINCQQVKQFPHYIIYITQLHTETDSILHGN